MKYFISLIFIIILSASLYWLYGTKTISGQVFIVTNGRGNVEMGSLEIRFIEEKELLEYGKKNFSEIFNLISEFEKKIKAEEKYQERGYKEFDYSNKWAGVVALEDEAKYGILGKIENFKMPLNVKAKYTEAKYGSDSKELSPILIVKALNVKLLSENSYPLNVFDMGVNIARTDSNGRFTAKIPLSKKGWLIAHCHRQVFDKEEKYYWIEPITSDSILLTNDNLWQ